MAIKGTEQKSDLSREGTNNVPTPTSAEQQESTLHNVSSADNNPPLPYKGPAPLKFQNPLVDSQLDSDPNPTGNMAAQALSSLHDVTSADNNPPLPYKGPAPLKFQNPLIDSKLNDDALGNVKYVDNLPK